MHHITFYISSHLISLSLFLSLFFFLLSLSSRNNSFWSWHGRARANASPLSRLSMARVVWMRATRRGLPSGRANRAHSVAHPPVIRRAPSESRTPQAPYAAPRAASCARIPLRRAARAAAARTRAARASSKRKASRAPSREHRA